AAPRLRHRSSFRRCDEQYLCIRIYMPAYRAIYRQWFTSTCRWFLHRRDAVQSIVSGVHLIRRTVQTLTAALALTATLWSNSDAATVDEALQVFDKRWPLWCEGRSLPFQCQNVTDAAERNSLSEQWHAMMDQIEQQTRN